MIVGTVTSDGVPVIELEIGGEHWTAIIDTGFNGALELPQSLMNSIQAEYVGEVTSQLAAGQRIKEECLPRRDLVCWASTSCASNICYRK